MSAKMKAYIASDRNGDEGTCIVVFAETAGKAKAYTAGTDTFCDYGFTGIRVNRNASLDRFYRGKPEMDWFDQKERMAMVRYADTAETKTNFVNVWDSANTATRMRMVL